MIISSGAISDHQQWRTISVVVETGCICRVSIRSTPSAVTNGTQIKRPYNSYNLVGAKIRVSGHRRASEVNESQWPSEASRRPPEGNQTQSDAIRRHRRAIRRNQTPSDAIRRHQTPSDAIRRHQTQSDSHRRTARSSSGAVPGGIAQVDGRWNWTVKRTCGEGRGAVVSTCMLEHLHDGRWNWTVKRTSKPRRNETQ